MSEILTDNEKLILSKVFEGEYPPFKILENQIENLRIKSRRKKYHTISVEFEPDEMKTVAQLIGREDNIKIRDTRIYINESDVTLYISVTVMCGYVKYLSIGGDYHFEKDDFTIKGVAWANRNDDPRKEDTIVYNANERAYEKAIGYLPIE